MRKRASSVFLIRPAAAGSSNQPDPSPPAGSAVLAPPQPGTRSTRNGRRSDRMLPISPRFKRAEDEAIENADITSQISFLAATCDDICGRFLRGVSEYEIARVLGGRVHNVARIDVERVVREGFRAERSRRIELERAARKAAA